MQKPHFCDVYMTTSAGVSEETIGELSVTEAEGRFSELLEGGEGLYE